MTLSYSTLRNSGRGGLIGSSETRHSRNGFITFHHNLYENIDSRTPAAARRHRAHLQQLLREPQRVRHQLPGRRQGQGGEQLLQELQGRPGHLLHRPRPATWQVSGNIFDNVTWSGHRQREQPRRPEPDVQHHGQHPVLLQPRRGELRAEHRRRRRPAPTRACRCRTAAARRTTPTADRPPRADPHHARPRRRRPPPADADASPAGPTSASGPVPTAPARPAGRATATCSDGNMSTYWSPAGSTGSISIKWGSATTVSTIDHP